MVGWDEAPAGCSMGLVAHDGESAADEAGLRALCVRHGNLLIALKVR